MLTYVTWRLRWLKNVAESILTLECFWFSFLLSEHNLLILISFPLMLSITSSDHASQTYSYLERERQRPMYKQTNTIQ